MDGKSEHLTLLQACPGWAPRSVGWWMVV